MPRLSSLALGIAANGTVFTLVNGALLRDLPFDAPDRIVALGVEAHREHSASKKDSPYLELRDWQTSARTFEGIGGYDEQTMNVSDEERAPERFEGAFVSSNAFALIGHNPFWVARCKPEDDREGAPPLSCSGGPCGRRRYQGSS